MLCQQNAAKSIYGSSIKLISQLLRTAKRAQPLLSFPPLGLSVPLLLFEQLVAQFLWRNGDLCGSPKGGLEPHRQKQVADFKGWHCGI